MAFPIDPRERQPKGDHNRRLSLGLDPEQLAAAAGVTVEALREYERTGPDHDFDVTVAERVGEALERLEQVIPNSEAAGVNLLLGDQTREDVLIEDGLEQHIRDAAYLLWDADGRPEGRDQEYWYRASTAQRPSVAGAVPASTTDLQAAERAFEASRKIGLQREFKKSPDDTVSGGFNQKPNVSDTPRPEAEPIESGTGLQMDDNIDDLGRRPDGTQQETSGIDTSSQRGKGP